MNPTPAEITRNLKNAQVLDAKIKRLHNRKEHTLKRLRRLQNARLSLAGVFFVALAIAISYPRLRLEAPLVVLFLMSFIPLVVFSRRRQRFADELGALADFFARQKARLKGEAPLRLNTEHAEREAKNHPLAFDLGLVGPLSLFSLIDETLTDEGEKKLLRLMAKAPASSAEIKQRQALIKGLGGETWLYTKLCLKAHSEEFRLSSFIALDTIKRSFVEKGFERNFIINILAWVAMVIIAVIGRMTETINPALPLTAYVLVAFWTLNRTESAFTKAVGLENHLGLLAPIFARLEKRLENSKGKSIDQIFVTVKSHGPSREMRKLSRALSFAGIQANPILHILINAVFPWSITATYVLEKIRQEIAETLPRCLDELAEFEALMSLALLERYQTQTYPLVIDGASPRLEAGFHPLIKRHHVVANDFSFSAGKRLGLLTGSNMSGKSTFLRTLGINQILANMGAPVFARALTTGPYQVETCIEVSDSLRDGFSYFYAEVRRLKELIARAEKHAPSPVLYLIDEIFRGTNNRERQIGSRAVIRALARTNAYGLVSTHDLELTSLSETQPALENFHFREEIIETATGKSEMHFTYHLNQGPCPTTNALRIMADEGIDVSGLEALPSPK